MTLLLTLSSIICATILGHRILGMLPSENPPEWQIVKLALAITTGLALTSILLFAWITIFNGHTSHYVYFEILLTTLTIALFLYKRQTASIPACNKTKETPTDSTQILYKRVKRLFWGLLTMMITSATLISFNIPHGKWDAWAIWNLKARFLIRGGAGWTQAFSEKISFSHPDYPLLLPLSVVRGWLYAGYETITSPIIIGIIFSVAVLLMLFGAILAIRGPLAAILAAAILSGTPFFVSMAVSQYADIPLAFYFLATLVMLARYNRHPDPGQLIIAGITTGFAAWTKNEGMLFTAVTSFYVLLMLLRSRERTLSSGIKHFCAGLIPAMIPVIIFKITLAPPNDLLSATANSGQQLLWQYERYFIIASHMIKTLVYFGRWQSVINGLFNPIAIMTVCLFWTGIDMRSKENWILSGIISAMIAGYFIAYLVSPYDLRWHLSTSCDRLFLQLWPSAIFAFFITVGEKCNIVPETDCASMALEHKISV